MEGYHVDGLERVIIYFSFDEDVDDEFEVHLREFTARGGDPYSDPGYGVGKSC